MRHVSRPYGPIYGPLIAAALLLAVPALAQTTVTDQSGSNSASTAGAAANNRNTNRLSNVGNQSATGAISGTQVNAPISSRSGATATTSSGSTSNAQSGTSRVRVGGQTSSQSVRVVNVTPGYSGGGSGGGTNGTNGANAVDPAGPAGANGTNGANSADPPALGSAGNPLTENIGGTTTLRNTPEIVAPNISGGNPCLVGISGGGAGPGIGITLGIGYSDKGCERRNSAALLSNIGEKDVAIELMCDDQNVREAMLRSGHPCAADRAVATPVAQVDPAVVRRQQDAAVAQQVAAKPARPDWCQTASAQELRTHPQCD